MIWSISYRPFDLSIQMRISIYDWNRIFRNKVIDGFHLVYCECITWYKQYFVYFQCIQVTEGVKIESQIFFELVSFISRLAQIKVQPEKMSDLSIFQQESDTSVSPSGKATSEGLFNEGSDGRTTVDFSTTNWIMIFAFSDFNEYAFNAIYMPFLQNRNELKKIYLIDIKDECWKTFMRIFDYKWNICLVGQTFGNLKALKSMIVIGFAALISIFILLCLFQI